MDQKRPVSSNVGVTARRKKLFKPLLQAPIVAFIFMLHVTASAFTYNDADFDLNRLMMVITPDHFPIIWKHAQKYPINYSDTSGMSSCVGDSGPPTYDLIYRCPDAVIGMGGTTGYKIFRDVPGYGVVEVYYKLNGSIWEVVGTVANLDGDPQGDNTDPDIDGDGVANERDQYPRDPNLWDDDVQDSDVDGVPNAYDAYPYDASRVTATVGKMSGEFSVSESGSATYSLPIEIPPGRGGLVPELALGYDNQSGNGYMGMGWNLLGLSAITRCVPDSRSYGFNRIKFDGSDKFCLDGQLLIEETVTGSDSYGSYKQYRTQVDNLSRIRSYGNTSTGPTSFRVWTRSGKVMEYGISSSIGDELTNGALAPASRVEAQGKSQVLVWALNKVSDSSNNYFTVSYREDAANGEYYPLSIHYTANSNQGLAPFNSITFEYQGRPDPSLHYVTGSVQKMTVKMSGIKILNNGELFKQYKLFYGALGMIGKSVLKKIVECDKWNNCLAPLSLEWSGGGEGTFTPTYGGPDIYVASSLSGATEDVGRVRFGDFNADGKTDVYRLNGPEYDGQSNSAETHTAYLSNGDGSFNKVNAATFKIWSFAGIHAVNGDIYVVSPFSGDQICGLSSCAAGPFTPVTLPVNYETDHFNTDITRIKFGRFNSVSNSNVYYVRGYNTSEAGTVFMSNGYPGAPQDTGPAFHISNGHDYARFDIARVMFADFNGDGFSDLFRVNGWDGSATPSIYFSNGNGYFTGAGSSGPVLSIGNNVERGYTDLGRINFGDFNGDGLSDIMLVKSHGNTINSHIYISRGDGTFDGPKTMGPATYVGASIDSAKVDVSRIKLGDFNGDGMTDVYYVRGWDSTDNSHLFLSKGDGTFITVTNGPSTHIGNNTERALSDIARINLEDFNGDGMTDIYHMVGHGTAPGDHVYFSQSKPILLHKIGDAGEGRITVDYKSVKAGNQSRSLTYVVSKASTDNGIGGFASKSYSYGSLRVSQSQTTFSNMTVTDDQTGIKTEAQYDTGTTHFGFVTSSIRKKPDNTPISSTKYFYDGLYSDGTLPECAPGNLKPVCKLVEKTYDFDSTSTTPLATVTTTTTYDAHGNATNVEVKTEGDGGPFTTTTVNQYTEDRDEPDVWYLGRLTHSTVTKAAPNNSLSIRTSAFNYHPTTGMLIREVIEPDKGANVRLTTHYKRDGFGNITHTTLCEGSIPPSDCHENTPIPATGAGVRRTITSYESGSNHQAGVFPTKVKNALEHEETRVYDTRFGLVKSVTGPNGLTTTSQYDNFGRKVSEYRADGTQTSTSYTFCSPYCPTVGGVTAKYMVTTISTGSAPSTVYFDAFDREIRRSSPGFDSPSIPNDEFIYVDTQYDSKGRILRVSEPYFAGNASLWTEYTYDGIGRVTVLNQPHTTANVLTDYIGLATEVTDVMGRKKIETKNAIGQTTFVTEADNTADEITTEYRYDAAGNLKETQIAGHQASLVQIFYDDRGRKEELRDPDMGIWRYVYNSFGQLVSQTDALNQTTQMEYNSLGQLTKRIDRFGSSSERISEWSFGGSESAHNIGKPVTITVTDPNPDADSLTTDPASNSTRSFLYDSVGRLYRTTDTIAGETFVTEQSYDGAGRPDTLTYPAPNQNSTGFKVKRVYKSNGYLEKVQTPDASKVFWRANELNARGQLVTHTLGNGIDTTHVYDSATGWVQGIMTEDTASNVVQHVSYGYFANGSLESRTDYRQGGLSENFAYDSLNRLHTSQVSGQTVKNYNYDPLGNITFKTGVGYYKYGADCAVPAGLHAVCEIRSAVTDGSLLKSYAYNANGNASLSAGREVDYTGFNKPMRFTEGSTVLSFVYGADLNRIFQETIAPGKHSKTYYVGLGDAGGALFERETDVATGHRENRHYIYAGGASSVAMHVVKDNGSTTLSVSNRYFHHDHLGSVEAISDDSGLAANAVYMSYDAWGQRRNPNWTDATGGLSYVDGARGFTGHENLPEISLIHMNGRVYDPVLGRFQSADPYMQPAEISQGMNRYGYVLNNPLTNIDPTGYKSIFRRAKDSIQREWKEFWKRDLKPFLNRLTRHCTGCGAGYDSSQGFHVGAESSPYGTYRNDDSIAFEIGSAAESALTINRVNPATAAGNTIAASSGGEANFANGSETVTQGVTVQHTEAAAATGADDALYQESFGSYFIARLMSGQVRDDIFTYGGSLVSSFTFGIIEPSFADRNSPAYTSGQTVSFILGGAGLVRSLYFVGTRGIAKLASASGNESLVLFLSGARNLSKLSNPTLWFNPTLRSVHMIPPSVRLSEAGSVAALAQKIGHTNTAIDAAVIPLTPFLGAGFNE